MSGIELNPGPVVTKSDLALCHININSLAAPNKLSELEHFTATHAIDILALSETKLDDTVHPNLYRITGFHSPFTRHRNRNGGGTAIYAHSSLPFSRLPELELPGEEWVWTTIKTKYSTLIICSVYLPPNPSAQRQQEFIDHLTESITLSQAYNPTGLFVTGDFNTGNIYLPPSDNRNSGVTAFDHRLKDATDTLDLTQLIVSPSRITEEVQNLRDLIFVSSTVEISDSGILSSFSTLDHFPVYVKFALQTTRNYDVRYKEIWDYNSLDSNRLTNILMATDWTRILNLNLNDAVQQFTETLRDAARQSIPIKQVRIRQNDKPWITSELKKEIRKRNRLFKAAKESQQQHDWRRWRVQRNQVTNLNRNTRDEHFKMKLQNLLQNKHNPHKYHTILKSLMGFSKNSVIPPLVSKTGTILNNDTDKAEMLNEHFVAQTQLEIDPSRLPPTYEGPPTPILDNIRTTDREVLSLLNLLDANKASGPDMISTKLLKLTALLISEPLAKLFNKSLTAGIYPEAWKEAIVQPIFKNKGSSSDTNNYRPISLLPCISKIFEKIIFDRIYKHISQHSLLTEKQSGYRPGHNTQMQLMYFANKLYKSLDSGHDFTAIYLDISKYFDKIWHKGLLYKCKTEFGISGKLQEWLKSYLEGRRQKVRINDSFSAMKTLGAGVPQGSVLGPLLAILYLNKLAGITHNEALLFADDTSLATSHIDNNTIASQQELQNDLDAIFQYGDRWAITFNASKTIQQTFSNRSNSRKPCLTFGGQAIPVVTKHKHLGLTFSTELKFHEHINETIKRAQRAMSPLYPIAKFLPRNILHQIYKTYISPIFDYCDVVYDGLITLHDAHRLEVTQNRAKRLITGTPFRTSTDGLGKELGMTTLTTRREIHRLELYQKLRLDGRIPDYITATLPNTRTQDTGRTLRNRMHNTLPHNRIASYQRSFIPHTTRQWNGLPEPVKSLLRISQFKKAIFLSHGPSKPSKYYSFGNKNGNILHTKLRLGISELNCHQFQIQKVDTTSCNCGHMQENTQHFVLDCPLQANIRRILFENVSQILRMDFVTCVPSKMLDILIHGKGLTDYDGGRVASCFQTFLSQTNRFA